MTEFIIRELRYNWNKKTVDEMRKYFINSSTLGAKQIATIRQKNTANNILLEVKAILGDKENEFYHVKQNGKWHSVGR